MATASGAGAQSGSPPAFAYGKHLAIVAVGVLLLLARDFANSSGKGAPAAPESQATHAPQPGANEELAVDKTLEVPEGSMPFLDTSSGGKSSQRLFMEEHSVGHKVHISFCSS